MQFATPQDMEGWTMIHNHPDGGLLSDKDVEFARDYKLAKSLIVCGDKTYALDPVRCSPETYHYTREQEAWKLMARLNIDAWNDPLFYLKHAKELWLRLVEQDIGISEIT